MKNLLPIITLTAMVSLVSCKQDTGPAKPTQNCKHGDFCVLSKMPLLSQASSSLPPIIRNLSGERTITKDTGWCAPVSSTMAFAGLKLEKPHLKYNSVLDDATNINSKLNMNALTGKYGEMIYYVGDAFKTRWVLGGTYNSKRKVGYQQIYNKVSNVTSKNVVDQKIYTYLDNQYFIDMFRKHKPAMSFSIYRYDKQSNGKYKINGGHAVTLNGFEDGHLKIYDPWGRIYNVDLEKDGSLNQAGKMKHVKGTSSAGYVGLYDKGNRKVLLHHMSYLFVDEE